MKILVDADACPVKQIIIKIAKKNKIPVVMVSNTSHIINDDYSEVITVDKERDSADLALINKANRGDIVVTQDYGVATLAIGKGAKALNQNGMFYTENNIDMLMFERHLSQKIRRSGGRTSGPTKRAKENDIKFEEALVKLLEE